MKTKKLTSKVPMTTPVVLPDIQDTEPDVFILESLDSDDEKHRRFEGQAISDILRLAGMNPKYYYFQSVDELPHLVNLYRQSKYRFLHISCHATSTHLHTHEEHLTYSRFACYFKGALSLRRLFVSACEAGNQSFVDHMANGNKGMHSIVAPAEKILFEHSAALWIDFYSSILSSKAKGMKRSDIDSRLRALASLFPVDMYFAAYEADKDSWSYDTVPKSC